MREIDKKALNVSGWRPRKTLRLTSGVKPAGAFAAWWNSSQCRSPQAERRLHAFQSDSLRTTYRIGSRMIWCNRANRVHRTDRNRRYGNQRMAVGRGSYFASAASFWYTARA